MRSEHRASAKALGQRSGLPVGANHAFERFVERTRAITERALSVVYGKARLVAAKAGAELEGTRRNHKGDGRYLAATIRSASRSRLAAKRMDVLHMHNAMSKPTANPPFPRLCCCYAATTGGQRGSDPEGRQRRTE